jgi:CDP-glucose 4,6-dehydratase
MENLGINMAIDLFNDFYRGKKILITGNTGFKGSWLSIWLNELGAEVHGYALQPKSDRDNYVTTGLSNIINHTDGDIRDLSHLRAVFETVKPDIAFHLAAQALVLESYSNPVETFETNVMGTVHFFEAVRNTPSVKIAINVTSDKCYQNNEWIWGYRENDPMGGIDPYSASKGCSELITNSYQKFLFSAGNCLVASGRAGNVIGGGDWAENRIIPDIFRAYFNNQEVIIRNPNATRPWQFVLEPVFGYMKLAEQLHCKGQSYMGGWNFGPLAGVSYSVSDVIAQVKKTIPALKYKSQVTDNKPHEANLLKLDISKALNYLDWRPLLNFDETIQYTMEGYLAEKGAGNVYQNRVAQIENYVAKF